MVGKAGRASSGHAGEAFWLSPASYWMPAHFPVSAWLGHAPFAAWLIDELRPASIVELGTHYGFSAFAFAEAVRRLRLSATVQALDTWQGDDHAGYYDETVYDYVKSVVAVDYEQIIELVRGRFDESRPRVADGSVDLLHIDGRHAYEDVLTDYSEWRSSVRDGGIILFHDIAERDQGFGVWRLWEEIAEPGRSFSFSHAHGLGVLAVGGVSSARLRSLFDADASVASTIRDDYARLGETVSHRAWLETLPGELDRVNALAHERALRVNELSAQIAAQRDLNEALRTSTSWRLTAPLRAVGKVLPRRR